MKAKSKAKYKYKKKYQTGVQQVGNADPTKLYEQNREGAVADMEYNNAQQAGMKRDLQQQQLSDTASQTVSDYATKQDQAKASSAALGSTVSKTISSVGTSMGGAAGKAAGVAGPLIEGGMMIGSAMQKDNNTKAMTAALAGDTKKQAAHNAASVLTTDTGTKLASAKSGVDVAEAFIPIDGLFGKSSTDKAQDEAVYAKSRKDSADEQIKKYGATDSTYQTAQAKKGKKHLKYKMKAGSREIETEGREPIFSPKKSDGTRDLLYYNPNDPTHKEGGVKAVIVPKSKYKMSSDSSLKVPEGSAIVTANAGKNKQAIEAYKKKDYKKLDKVINQMPEDSPKKKKVKGVEESYLGMNKNDFTKGFSSGGGYSNDTPTGIYAPEKEVGSSLGYGFKDKSTGTEYSSLNEAPAIEKTKGGSKVNIGSVGSLASSASGIYNIAKGAFDKSVKTKRRYVNNEGYKYKDLSQPAKNAVNEESLVNANNLRNATGGQGSSYLSNMAMGTAAKRKALTEINNQESGKRMDIENKNIDVRNAQKKANLQLANQYDDTDLRHKGKQSEYVGKGIEQLSNVAQMRELNNNRATSDKALSNTIGTDNYIYNEKGERVPRKKKGSKNLKYKMKK